MEVSPKFYNEVPHYREYANGESPKEVQALPNIFDREIAKLHKIIEENKRDEWHGLYCAKYLAGAGIVGGGLNYLYSFTSQLHPALLLCCSIIPAVLSFNASFKHENAQSLLNECEWLNRLDEAFEKFKINPSHENILKLFRMFEESDGISAWSEFIPKEDVGLFLETGKLFLMDAVAKILKEQMPYSFIIETWESTLATTIETGSKVENAEPWVTLGIENPGVESYLDFQKKQEFIDSLEISEKLITLFKNVINKAIPNGKI